MEPPSKIQAALEYLTLTFNAEGKSQYADPEDGRQLDSLEQNTKNAALRVLIQYFNNEQDFADPPETK